MWLIENVNSSCNKFERLFNQLFREIIVHAFLPWSEGLELKKEKE